MDGENNGKPYEQMDDLGVPLFLETPIYIYVYICRYLTLCLLFPALILEMHLMDSTARLRCVAPDYRSRDVDCHLIVRPYFG